MELCFLGTSAGKPTPERNVTSIVFNLTEERGAYWLFDCGEGTQHQLMRASFRLSRLENIFITHLHGDHLFGLPGLMSSRSLLDGAHPLTVFGPPGLKRYMDTVLEISQARIEYPWQVREIGEGIVFEDEFFVVESKKLDHRIESFGYRIREKDRPGRLLDDRLKAAGVAPGPIYGKIKRGEDVVLEDGTVLSAKEFTAPPIPGRVVTILGDTRYCRQSVELARQADVVVHEATFDEELSHLAQQYYHSTAQQAAGLAREAEARTLILTHFSTRYRPGDVERILDKVRTMFPNTYAAEDFMRFPVEGHVLEQ